MKFISERPVKRSLLKFFAPILWGRSLSHAQSWSPGLKLKMPEQTGLVGSIIYRKQSVAELVHPAELKARAGSEIFVIGTGPSVKDNDLSRLGADTAILLNGAISLMSSVTPRPLAIAVEDERFVWRHFALMRSNIMPGTRCLLSVSVIRAICELDAVWLRDKTIIVIEDILKPYGAVRRKLDELRSSEHVRMDGNISTGFSHDPSIGVFQGGSVVVSALQFAVYCEPKIIGLFGIDLSNARQPRFYENAMSTAKSGVYEARERIVRHILLTRDVFGESGGALANYSKVSALCAHGVEYHDDYAIK